MNDQLVAPATKVGRPIQAVLWLEWDNTALDAPFWSSGALALSRPERFTYELPLRLRKNKPIARTAGEQGGEGSLHRVVMEESQQAVNPPGDGQHQPDYRAPHLRRLPVDTASMQQIHFPAWLPQLPRVRLQRSRLRRAW